MKHIPQRTCIACKEVLSKRSLIRLTAGPDGIILDPTGKAAGRGAYLHDKQECWEKALSRGLLAKSLKVSLTEKDAENIKRWMEELPKS